jgi:malate permease and related proteins
LIINAVGAVLSIFFMIGIGVFIYWRKWIDRQGASVFAKIVINVALPANVIYSFLTKFEKSLVLESGIYLLVAVLASVMTYFISIGISILFKVDKSRRGIFSVLFSFSNSVFIGFPVAQALFGDSGMLYAVLFYIVNTTMFWTLGYSGIRRDGERIKGTGENLILWDVLKKLINIPLISILLGFLLVITDITLPLNVISTLKYISGLTSPLSLIFTGIVLADIGLKKLKFEMDVLKVMLGRFLIAPLAMFLMTFLFKIDGLGQQVFIVQMTLPVMLQSVIMAEYYGADTEFAAKSFAWTTIASLISIPCYMIIINILF